MKPASEVQYVSISIIDDLLPFLIVPTNIVATMDMLPFSLSVLLETK